MKTLRNRFLIVAGAVLLATSPLVRAEPKPERPEPGARGEMAQQRLKMMAEHLQLTPEQIEQIKPILRGEMESMRALRDESEGKDRREKMREIREKGRAQIEAILTPEQKAKLDSMPRRGPGPNGDGPRPQ